MDTSQLIQALYLKWDQQYKGLKATSPAQMVKDILTSGHYIALISTLIGLCSSDPPLVLQDQTLNYWEHIIGFSLNQGYMCASNLYYLWMETSYASEGNSAQSFAR